MPVRQTLIIVNPASAHGRTRREWPAIARAARAFDPRADVVLTTGPDEATALARDAITSGARKILAVGGDGTVSEIANGFMQAEPAVRDRAELAIVMRGSGCDTARTLGLPRETRAALEVAFRGQVKMVDLGLAHAADGRDVRARHFVTIGGVGLTAAVADRVNRSSKPLGGRVAYAWATLAAFARYRNAPQRVEIDDRSLELVANSVVIGNGGTFAGGMRILPHARLDDGLLDVVVWGDVSGLDFVRTLPRLYRGTHLGHPAATFDRGARVRVSSPMTLGVEVDGEMLGSTPATFSVVPHAIRLRVSGAGGRA